MIRIYDIGNNEVMTYNHSSGEYDLGINKNSYDQQLKDYYDMLPEPPKTVWTAPSTGLYPGTGNPKPNRSYWSDIVVMPSTSDNIGLKPYPYYHQDPIPVWTEQEVNRPDQTKPVDPADKQVGGNHYKDMKIQPMEYIEANNLNWAEGNVIKYVTRHSYKNGKEDLEKAIHMLELIIKSRYGNGS